MTFCFDVDYPNAEIKASPTLDRLRIMVVDDNIDHCDVTSCCLEMFGFEVVARTSAQEALDMITEFEPHLLVIDIAMPNVDGYTLIRTIRSLPPPICSIPAIALTGLRNTLRERELAIRSGFQTYLVKPIQPKDLVVEVLKLVGQPLVLARTN
ncbi:MAG: response regulator [Chlorogloeopsis fritschii C42_A2020_084]|nr:response regulator [Chlorogloeopsis fritschii]MBF2006127.1 response regulator [Chlorogloeopsis fritschii C42_A2020_084]